MLLVPIHALLTVLADPSPKPEDVKAGWTAFALFLLLVLAVVLLGFSLVKQLRKAQAAKDAGLFGPDDDATEPRPTGSAGDADQHQGPQRL
ncbi:hypothetical protein H5V45_06670 [Nocardioides sp. KIGAM211]|uniref:Uncharacterized protein n=1 Tax=Nocardioides luti TaxID=2761101 RepID=A0A7X0REZ7_9ACTN|nr:hypothetical protein [Nocardioides luti]MBB6627002.1 hypothetical protein [Nocardioides luti]